MAKSVAVVSGIVLMGAVFSGCGFLESMFGGNTSAKSTSTKAKTASNEANSEGKCSGNAIKTNIGIEKGVCKGGKREGVWKYYDKSGYELQQERTYKNGKLDGAVKWLKGDKFIEIAKYADGKPLISYGLHRGIDEYLPNYISFSTIYTNEYGDIEIGRKYYEVDIESENKDLKEQAERQNKQAEEQAKQKAQEIAKKNAESKVKKPTMQEVAKSKGIMDSYRAKLQAQYDIEYQKALQNELNKIKKIEPKYIKNDTMDDYLAYIKSNNIKPALEGVEKGNLVILAKEVTIDNTYYHSGEYEYKLYDNNYSEDAAIGTITKDGKCYPARGYSCAAFAKIFKELIDKSVFKDKIYSGLQNR